MQNGETFVAKCERGGFAGFRLAPGTSIRIDLQKTNSVLSPYLGIVAIVGEFEENTRDLQEQAAGKDRCYPSVAEAQSISRFWGNSMTYSFVLNYQVNGLNLQLTNADFRFMNNGGNDLFRRVNEATDADWNAVLSAPLH
ncbi:hypothetical protein [Mesorhizobium sp. WSM3882]|uniref:hypothetical protein n=1 Tax=Mesorhizobium sp. WSM3882 TaxID=2029407 RepID=UPI001180EE11|nr:hypothetical protein [Mesorhizobium sp. WSM3882]